MDMFLRCSIGTMGILCNFWAVDHMRIADANILNKLSPFFAILMSIFILKERPNRVEWLSVLLAFIGAAFVAKPGAGIASFPALVAILGGFTAGTAYTYVRKLGLDVCKAVCLPGPGRMFRGDRAAFRHCRLPERSGQGYLRFRLLTSRICGDVRIPAVG